MCRILPFLFMLLTLSGCLFSSKHTPPDPAVVKARNEQALRSYITPILNKAAPLKPVTTPVTITHGTRTASYDYTLEKITLRRDGNAFKKQLLDYDIHIKTQMKGDKILWDVVISDVTLKTVAVEEEALVSASFATDYRGANLIDYKDRVNPTEPIPTDMDFIVNNFKYREGPFVTGDEIIDLYMTGFASPVFIWTLPQDSKNFVLQGTQKIDGADYYVLTLSVDNCLIRMKNTRIEVTGKIRGKQLIDCQTNLPYLYEVSLFLNTPIGTQYERRFTLIRKEAIAERKDPAQ